MYYRYDNDENYTDPYLFMPSYPMPMPMINNDMIDYSMTRQQHLPQQYPGQYPGPGHGQYPQQHCGPNGRWVPGRWVRRWVPGHCEYGHGGYPRP